MKSLYLLAAMAVLSACSGLNSDEAVLVYGERQSSFKRTPANSPVQVYFPTSNQLISLESVLYGELGNNNASTTYTSGSFDRHTAIDTEANDEPRNDEDVRTNIRKLSGLEIRHPNWILDSAPSAARVSGLSTPNQLTTPYKIINLPEETAASLVATKQGYGRCRYDQAKRTDVFEKGMDWIHLLCILSPP